MSRVPWPNHDASWITCSWSRTGSRATVFGIHVVVHASHIGRVQRVVNRPERVVEYPVITQAGVGRMPDTEERALLLTAVGRGDDIGLVVEIGGRAQEAQLDAVGVVAPLEIPGARVGEGQVAAEPEVVRHPVRRLEPRRGAGEMVVRSDDHTLVVAVVPREVERGAVVAPRDREAVVEGVSDPVQLVRMVERGPEGVSRRDRRTP